MENFLDKIPDKPDYFKTTSHKFKTDFEHFFALRSDVRLVDRVCVELGTHSGRGTRFLSHLFKEVYTFEIEEKKVEEAKEFNKDRDNIHYFQMNIYNEEWWEKVPEADFFFIDAVHDKTAVLTDVANCMNIDDNGKKWFIFDDYGLVPGVKAAINELATYKLLSIEEYIGHEEGWNYGPGRTLKDWEGVICRET